MESIRPTREQLADIFESYGAEFDDVFAEDLDLYLEHVEDSFAGTESALLQLCVEAAFCFLADASGDTETEVNLAAAYGSRAAANAGWTLDQTAIKYSLSILAAHREAPGHLRDVAKGELRDCFESALWRETGQLPGYQQDLLVAIFHPMSTVSHMEAVRQAQHASDLANRLEALPLIGDVKHPTDYSDSRTEQPFDVDAASILRVDRARASRADALIVVATEPYSGLSALIEWSARSQGVCLLFVKDDSDLSPLVRGHSHVEELEYIEDTFVKDAVEAIEKRQHLLAQHRVRRVERQGRFAGLVNAGQTFALDGSSRALLSTTALEALRSVDEFAIASCESQEDIKSVVTTTDFAAPMSFSDERAISAEEYLAIRSICAKEEDPVEMLPWMIEAFFRRATNGVRLTSEPELRQMRSEIIAERWMT